MKKLISAFFGLALCFQAQALEIEFSCLQTLNTGDGTGVGRSLTKAFTLDSEASNSKMFSIFAGKDQNNRYLISLNET